MSNIKASFWPLLDPSPLDTDRNSPRRNSLLHKDSKDSKDSRRKKTDLSSGMYELQSVQSMNEEEREVVKA